MARAGYDPRDMAAMFRTIQQQDPSRAPQWLSDHPDPGNRSAYITQEAQALNVAPGGHPTGELPRVQAELKQLPPAPTTEQIMKNAQAGQASGQSGMESGQAGSVGTSGTLSSNVPSPASEYRTYNAGNVFSVAVPSNWQELQSAGNSITFAPQGAYGSSSSGSSVFTHGIELGITPAQSGNLQSATDDLVRSLAQGNPQLKVEGTGSPTQFAGREGLQLRLQNVSEVTGSPETVLVTTTLLDGGNLLYSIGVAPSNQFREYSQALQRVNASVRLQQQQ